MSESKHEQVDNQVMIEATTYALLSAVSIYVAAVKDPAFQGEREWRLVQYQSRELPPDESVKFRSIGNMIVPYIPTRLCYRDTSILPLSEIIIGPTVSPLAERAVKSLLGRHNMWNVNRREITLQQSSVPLQIIR